jgi:hypothetical protein
MEWCGEETGGGADVGVSAGAGAELSNLLLSSLVGNSTSSMPVGA